MLEYFALKGELFSPVPLAFRPSHYGREQRVYDPYIGLQYYGPYKPVNVKILHLIPKNWNQYITPEFTESLKVLLENILDLFLKKTGNKVKFESEHIDDIMPILSSQSIKYKRIIKDFVSLFGNSEENIVLIPIPKYILKENSSKLYVKLKALGLKEGFISQLYSDKVIKAVKKYARKGDDSFNNKAILLNLALNIFAKAGGIPWALYNELEYDIIIGFSWSIKRSNKLSTGPTSKCYGVVHTFSKLGVWERCKSFISGSKEELIIQALQESLDYIMKNEIKDKKHRRILIMTREFLREDFTKKISKYLSDNYNYYLDIAMVSSNVAIRLYDLSSSFYIAPRGLYFIQSSKTAYLVTTGKTKYSKYLGIGVPKPIRIKVLYSQNTNIDTLIRCLKATYFLTAMNWRSFWGKLRVPTPIHYSKLVARLFSLLDEKDINEAFIRKGNYIYKVSKYEDRPWFI